MNWQDQLITIYLYVCKHYQNHLWVYSQRTSNYSDLRFSGEEVITLYLFGVIDKNRELKTIYGYADRHLRDWFPCLPSYTAYVQRLNKVAGDGDSTGHCNTAESVRGKTAGEVIAIDGKTSRGSKDGKRGKSPLHPLSAWACENRLVLGQEATAEKSNEIIYAHQRLGYRYP